MEDENEFKSIKLELSCPTELGVLETKQVRVSVNTIKRLQDKNSYYEKNKYTYSMSFSVKLPDYIHAKILGATIPSMSMSNDKSKTYDVKLSKTISSDSIGSLTARWQEIIDDFVFLLELDKLQMRKVILYRFGGNVKQNRSQWTGASLGNEAKLSYIFMIGYIGSRGTVKVIRNMDNKNVQTHSDGWIYNLPYVDWTQEREDFFIGLQKSYESLIARIAEFEASINNDSIDTLILNSPLIKQLGA